VQIWQEVAVTPALGSWNSADRSAIRAPPAPNSTLSDP
jgi:hypothetical protein